MAPKEYRIDKMGDVVMRFKRYLPVEEENEPSVSHSERSVSLVFDHSEEDPADQALLPEHKTTEGPALEEPDHESTTTEDSNELQPSHSLPDSAADARSSSEEEEKALSEEVLCWVSSKHMMVASPCFVPMFSANGFKEGRALAETGSVTVDFPDDDPDAFLILLYIIHGSSRQVPRDVSLDLLTELAAIVGKYQMLEVVELWADTWIHSWEQEAMPRAFTEEAPRWLFISWVFEKESIFNLMSRLAQNESDETLSGDFEGLEISNMVLDAISKSREEAIGQAIDVIAELIQKYEDTAGSNCTSNSNDNYRRFACDATIYGSLMLSSQRIGILRPRCIAPYVGMTVKSTLESIRELKIADRCTTTYRFGQDSFGDSHGIKEYVEALMTSLEESLRGLDLSDFKRIERT